MKLIDTDEQFLLSHLLFHFKIICNKEFIGSMMDG